MSKKEKEEPFKIDVTMLTSEMLGKFILSKLETSCAWVVPIYDEQQPEPTDEKLREEIGKIICHKCEAVACHLCTYLKVDGNKLSCIKPEIGQILSKIREYRDAEIREIFKEIESYRFAEPQHIPQSGREPVIICLTEEDLQALKAKYIKGNNVLT